MTEVQARIGSDGEYVNVGESRDISIGGMFLSGSAPAKMGTQLEIRFDMPGLGLTVLPCYVRWVKEGGFGVQFGLIGARETHAIGRLLRASNAEAS